jgi:UDP-GlcNAc:undecaprenyl-phosphate GlcNAc-1-phosphate transferase
MKKIVVRLTLSGLLIAAALLAILTPPSHYYPAMDVAMEDSSGTMTLSFLLDARPSLTECERVNGNMAQAILKECPRCRITKLSCDSRLAPATQTQLSSAPIDRFSGRTQNGVISFQAAIPELEMVACRTAEAQSANTPSPIKCYAPKTERTPLPKPSPINIWSPVVLAVALICAWLVGWLIIRYEHLHADYSHDHVDSGPQKYHTQPTPRIGGLTVMAGLLGAGGVMLFIDAVSVEGQFGLLLLASVPAFLGGLVEDVTKRVGVLERLLLTMLSGAVAAWVLGSALKHLDLPGIDLALSWMPVAVIFTAFAVGGIANAINIIDGYNGLAGGFAVIVLTALAFVSHGTGDALVFNSAIALAGGVLGFLLWNWPDGKIFFGDGGAYLVGFLIAELSVLLVLRNPEVSPWFPLLLLIYPIFETIYSIYRRKFQNNLSPGQPDNQHLHQLIHDKLIPHQPHGKRFSRNSKVAKYLWIPTGVLAVVGSLFAGSTPVLASAALGFCVFYVVNYRRIVEKSVEKHPAEGIRSAH